MTIENSLMRAKLKMRAIIHTACLFGFLFGMVFAHNLYFATGLYWWISCFIYVAWATTSVFYLVHALICLSRSKR